jgi:hypothetical protein
VWLGLAGLLGIALFNWREYHIEWTSRATWIFGVLLIATPLTALFLGVEFPAGSTLPVPGVPEEPAGSTMMIFSAVPWVLAGGLLGPIAGAGLPCRDMTVGLPTSGLHQRAASHIFSFDKGLPSNSKTRKSLLTSCNPQNIRLAGDFGILIALANAMTFLASHSARNLHIMPYISGAWIILVHITEPLRHTITKVQTLKLSRLSCLGAVLVQLG